MLCSMYLLIISHHVDTWLPFTSLALSLKHRLTYRQKLSDTIETFSKIMNQIGDMFLDKNKKVFSITTFSVFLFLLNLI